MGRNTGCTDAQGGQQLLARHGLQAAWSGTAVAGMAACSTGRAPPQKLGVRLDQLVISQPSSGDEALDIVAQLAGSSGGVEMIVVDSVAALIPRNELEGDIGMPTVRAPCAVCSRALLWQVLSCQG